MIFKQRFAKSTAILALALAAVFLLTGLFHLSQDLGRGIQVRAEEATTPPEETTPPPSESATSGTTPEPSNTSSKPTEEPTTTPEPSSATETSETNKPSETSKPTETKPDETTPPPQPPLQPPTGEIDTSGEGVDSVLQFVVRVYHKGSDTYEERTYTFNGKAGSRYTLTNPGIDGYTTYGLSPEQLTGKLKAGTTTINVAVVANDHANKDGIVSDLQQTGFLSQDGSAGIVTQEPVDPDPSESETSEPDPGEDPEEDPEEDEEDPEEDEEDPEPDPAGDAAFEDLDPGTLVVTPNPDAEEPEDPEADPSATPQGRIRVVITMVDADGNIHTREMLVKDGDVGGEFEITAPSKEGYTVTAVPAELSGEIAEGTMTYNIVLTHDDFTDADGDLQQRLQEAGVVDEAGEAIVDHDPTPLSDPEDEEDPEDGDEEDEDPEDGDEEDEDEDDEDEDEDEEEPEETEPTEPKPIEPGVRRPDWSSGNWRPVRDRTPARREPRPPQVQYPQYRRPSGGWVVRQPAKQEPQQPVDPTQPPIHVTQPTFDKTGRKDVEEVDKDRVDWPDRTTAETSVKELKTLPEPERQAASLPAKIFFAIVGGGVVLMGIGIGIWQIMRKR